MVRFESLYYAFIEKEEEDMFLLGENIRFLGKMNEPLEEQLGGMIEYDKVCFCVLSCDKSQSYLVDETPTEGIYDGKFFGGICL